MSKRRDNSWAEEMVMKIPPAGCRMSIEEGCALAGMRDRVEAVAAAYNYGFLRGCNYSKNKTPRE